MRYLTVAALLTMGVWLGCQKKPVPVTRDTTIVDTTAVDTPRVSPRMAPAPTGGDSLEEVPDSVLKDSTTARIDAGVDSILIGDTLTMVDWVADSTVKNTYTRRATLRKLDVTITGLRQAVVGIPFGPYGMDVGSDPTYGAFNLDIGNTSPGGIVSQISAARNRGFKLIFAMTGGGHDNYMSVISGDYQFDMNKWKNRMDDYNTSAIKNAVAAGVADGTILGNSVMDEPNAHGDTEAGGNTWGPTGTMTKVRVDDMCQYVRNIFPTMAVGVHARHAAFEPDKTYKKCNFFIDQYSYRFGKVDDYANKVKAYLQKQANSGWPMRVASSFNVINGGTQDQSGSWDCPQSQKGSRSPNCWMTPAQVDSAGTGMGKIGCASALWEWRNEFMGKSANQNAFKAIAGRLKLLPKVACKP